MLARGARSRGTPAAVLASTRAGPGLAASPPAVTPERGPCPAAAPTCVGRALSAQLSPRGGMGGSGSGDPRVIPWLGREGEGAAAALPRLIALWGAREGSPCELCGGRGALHPFSHHLPHRAGLSSFGV